MRIGTRIIFVALVPFLGLTALCAWDVNQELERWRSANIVNQHLAYAPAFSALAHELQKERGLSAGFLGSGGDSKFAGLLETQRKATDAANAALRAHLINDAESLDSAVPALKMVDNLDAARLSVSDRDWTVAEMAKTYTDTIVALLDQAAAVASEVSDVRAARAASAYVSILHAKELAGRERAMGAA